MANTGRATEQKSSPAPAADNDHQAGEGAIAAVGHPPPLMPLPLSD